jgi:4-amino-4-deoxy-L-arabinose transferase-like glycosyltransferase
MSRSRPRRIPGLLIVALVLGAGLRIGWSWVATRLPQGGHDPARYLIHALELADGEGYVRPDDGRPTAYYPVGYPLALSGLFRLVSRLPAFERPPARALQESGWRHSLEEYAEPVTNLVHVAVLVQVLLGVLTIYFVYTLANRLAGRRAAPVAAFAVAVFPSLIYYTGALMTETLFVALSIGALCVVATGSWSLDPPGFRRWLAFGVLVGCAALVRPIVLVWLALIPFAFALARVGARRVFGATLAAWIGAAFIISPWTARNVRVMQAPILVSTNLGENLCVGHHDGAPGHFVLRPACTARTPYGKPDVNPLWEVQRNADLRDQAIEFALANPGAEVGLLFKKLYFLLWHDHNGVAAVESYGKDPLFSETTRGWLERVADGYFFVILTLGLVGFASMLWPPIEPRRLWLVLAAASIAGVPILFFGHPRFHLPASPLLAVGAAFALTRGWRRSVNSPHAGTPLARSL